MPIRKSPRCSTHLAYLLDENAWGTPSLSSSPKRTYSVDKVPLSVYLWKDTQEFARQALGSGYVQGIKKANLKPEEFGGYWLQDSVFCYKAEDNIKKATTKATEPCVKTFLEEKAESYKELYKELFKTWHIEDPNGIILDGSCLAFINHLHNVAKEYDPIYLIVALIPCAKLWPWLGQQIGVSDQADFGVYTEWARKNFDPSNDCVKTYEIIIDKAESKCDIDRQTALQVYKSSMKGEADFFGSVKIY